MDDFRQMTVIWSALIGGVAMYALVAAFLVAGGMQLDAIDLGMVNLIAPGIMAYMLLGLLIRRAMLARLPEGDRTARIVHYRSATLIGLALMESGGLVVITLGMISGSLSWIAAGGGASVLMMLLARPSAEEAGVDPEGGG